MNPTTPNNIITTDSRRRRTSVSSTASTRSAWRVPLAKQPPRTQLSAVFAESEAPSRSPSNQQSAFSLLEARYVASSSVSSTLSTSPSFGTRIRLGGSPLEEGIAESSITTNPIERDNPRRGRQAAQRNISLAGVESVQAHPHTEQSGNNRVLEPFNTNPSTTVQPPSTAQNGTAQIMDWQSPGNPETELSGEQRKRKPSLVRTGWFGTSGRSNAQNVAPVVEPRQQQSVQITSSSTAALVVGHAVANLTTNDAKVEVLALAPPTNKPEEKPRPTTTSNNVTIQPSSSGWFSRSRVSTATAAPTPSIMPTQPDPISSGTNNNTAVVIPVPPPAQTPPPAAIHIAAKPAPPSGVSPSPSPSRASWFGSLRGRTESVSQMPPTPVPPLYALDTSMSAPQTPSRTATMELDPAPPSAMSESITDESMTATITPMTFSEAQARSNTSRTAGPQSWFKMGGKRESMTPSVDSRVPSLPSLPPSPKQDAAPLTVLVPISHPSVSSLGSSTARYTLSFPLLGKPKVKLEDALKEVGKDGAFLLWFILRPLTVLQSFKPSQQIPWLRVQLPIQSQRFQLR